MHALIAVCTLTALTHAATADDDPEQAVKEGDQVVLINATAKLGSLGAIDRVRRVLDSRGLMKRLPPELEAVLDGRGVGIADIEAIRAAFSDDDFKGATRLIQADQSRILQSVASGDPIPALAELSQWRGLIAASLGDEDTAISWFRAAYRFNPAWSPSRKIASPTVLKLFKAAQQPTTVGRLRVDADPEDAQVRIDGGEIHAAHEKIELQAGMHLVIISKPEHAPDAELVEIKEGKTGKITVALQKESKDDRAARLVDETVSAPPGKSRLKSAKPLAKLTGANRMLYVEDATDSRIVLRLYDVAAKKISSTIELDASATSAVIMRKVLAVLDSDNLVEPGESGGPGERGATAWYNHWYVWVGAAVVLGAAFGTYEYATRAPTAVRF